MTVLREYDGAILEASGRIRTSEHSHLWPLYHKRVWGKIYAHLFHNYRCYTGELSLEIVIGRKMRDLANTELMRTKLTVVSIDADAAVESETKENDIMSNNIIL